MIPSGRPGRPWVATSDIGESLRAARERAGWSREALAYHSGVSWSAIAQIESGRRKDVRLSTLSSLADALRVPVDALIGSSMIKPRLLEHRVLKYASDEEYAATTVPFLAEGIGQSDCLLAVTTPALAGLLREGLGGRSDQVEYVDSKDWYGSPTETLNYYRSYLQHKVDSGIGRVRIVGELILVGRSEVEITAWIRYEAMINIALSSYPATFICPYDLATLPPAIIDAACRTHPELAHPGGTAPCPTYQDAEEFLLQA